MNKSELKIALTRLSISEDAYSLEGRLVHNSVILYQSYQEWTVFYLDERGGRNNEEKFNSECSACWHIYKLFRDAQQVRREIG